MKSYIIGLLHTQTSLHMMPNILKAAMHYISEQNIAVARRKKEPDHQISIYDKAWCESDDTKLLDWEL